LNHVYTKREIFFFFYFSIGVFRITADETADKI